jgi:hypothetical protein
LTHFVGRNLPSDEEQFILLCKIIRDGVLLDISHIDRHDRIFSAGFKNRETGEVNAVEYTSEPNVRHDLSSLLSSNQLVQFEIVCFCDIPMADLTIHCKKYSYFGLSFSKSFLLKQGAAPVMYVPASGIFRMSLAERHIPSGEKFYEEPKEGPRSQLFDDLFAMHNRLGLLRYKELENQLFASQSNDEVDKVVKGLRTMLFYQTAVEANIFGHLKFFDPALPTDHLDNYYMEREWRVNGRISFKIGDIAHVLVPPAFVDRMISEFSELGSSITPLAAV